MSFPRAILVVFLLLSAAVAYAENTAYVTYEKPADATEKLLKKRLVSTNTVESVITFINDNFYLPEQLEFFFGGEEGPLYDSEDNQIFIPYSFVTEVEERFAEAQYEETGVSADEATMDAIMHTMFHEFAHSAIYMYDLPVIGKEEDAADGLATVLLIEYFEDGQEIAISAADLFNLESDDRDALGEEDFWDEHSLDEQRYYSTLCHVYGSNPKEYNSILEDASFSEERAELCEEEYEHLSESWHALLNPHMKPEN
ncbi:MAG: DUF4344 domain-containing metallopeptidase [Pseudomonadota bacterium]